MYRATTNDSFVFKTLYFPKYYTYNNGSYIKITKFSPHTLQIFCVCPLGDTTYVQAVDQFVPNILEHHLINGHYCIVDAFPQLYQCLTADSDNFVFQQDGSPLIGIVMFMST